MILYWHNRKVSVVQQMHQNARCTKDANLHQLSHMLQMPKCKFLSTILNVLIFHKRQISVLNNFEEVCNNDVLHIPGIDL